MLKKDVASNNTIQSLLRQRWINAFNGLLNLKYKVRKKLSRDGSKGEGIIVHRQIRINSTPKNLPNPVLMRPLTPRFKSRYNTFKGIGYAGKLIDSVFANSKALTLNMSPRRWRSIKALTDINVWHKRKEVTTGDGQLIYRRGEPMTDWESSNREMSRLLRLVDNGVHIPIRSWALRRRKSWELSLREPNITKAQIRTPATNASRRRYRKHLRSFNNWRRPLNRYYEVLETWQKSPLTYNVAEGLGHHGSVGRLRGGSRSRVIRLKSGSPLRNINSFLRVKKDRFKYITSINREQFDSNNRSFAFMRTLPLRQYAKRVWVVGTNDNTKRFSYRIIKYSKPVFSPLTNILPWSAVGYMRRVAKKRFVPKWWYDIKVANLFDKVSMAVGNSKSFQTNIGAENYSTSHFPIHRSLRSTVMRPRYRETLKFGRRYFFEKELKKVTPVISNFGYRPSGNGTTGYFISNNRFRTYFNFMGLQRSREVFQSINKLTTGDRTNTGLGIYQHHPRWTSKFVKAWPYMDYSKLSQTIHRRDIKRVLRQKKCFNRHSWLRNAQGLQ